MLHWHVASIPANPEIKDISAAVPLTFPNKNTKPKIKTKQKKFSLHEVLDLGIQLAGSLFIKLEE